MAIFIAVVLLVMAIVCWLENKRNVKLQKEIEFLFQMKEESLQHYKEIEKNNKELCNLKKRLAEQERIVKKLLDETVDAERDFSIKEIDVKETYSTEIDKENVICFENEKNNGSQHTGNGFVDCILERKRVEAEQKGIIFEVKTDLLPYFFCSEMDTISLLDNLLENAMESCERVMRAEHYQEFVENRLPFIKITFYERKMRKEKDERMPFVNNLKRKTEREEFSQIEIYLENSKLEIEKPLENHFKTVKEKQMQHGNGTGIISEIINKYFGQIKYRDDGTIFYCWIILPIKEKRNVF